MAFSLDDIKARFDATQRERPWLGFPVAVMKKSGDDKGNQLAALITYYGFFSLFPLLMVAFTVLGFVLQHNPQLQADIADTLRERLPLPGISAESISGNGFALVVGVALSLWSGLGATQVAQDAMNTVWDVPRNQQPNFFMKRVQGLLVLLVMGGGLALATASSSLVQVFGSAAAIAGIVLSFLVNAALISVLMRVLVEDTLAFGSLKWAAVVGGVGWTALQLMGGWYTNRLVDNADKTYGTFAVVIGLLSWILLQAKVLLYAAEVASVASRRLWPRSLDPQRPTDADRRVAEAIVARTTPLPVSVEVDDAAVPEDSAPHREVDHD
ncbi:MAG: YihY/virulence factor BrkB family protein [Actinobacteria bacterium]|nr:YihY/virulence factor BrkB family protein [Actinomycetota bacterium]